MANRCSPQEHAQTNYPTVDDVQAALFLHRNLVLVGPPVRSSSVSPITSVRGNKLLALALAMSGRAASEMHSRYAQRWYLT